MSRLAFRHEDDFWPTVRWGDSKLVAYYLGEDEEDIRLVESDGLDLEELVSRLERGESVFMTMKPLNGFENEFRGVA